MGQYFPGKSGHLPHDKGIHLIYSRVEDFYRAPIYLSPPVSNRLAIYGGWEFIRKKLIYI